MTCQTTRIQPQGLVCAGRARTRALQGPGGGARRAWRRLRAMASSSSSSSTSTTAHLRELKQELTMAVELEQYGRAAELRDKIRALEVENPADRLQRELAAAVNEERYQDAARLRDELAALRPPTPRFDVPATASKCSTEGVEIVARSYFSPAESHPMQSHYMFRYTIQITNRSTRTIKVMERHWVITNAHGNTQVVRGPGVVGVQPELPPGGTFSYESGVPIATPTGCMEGHYDVYLKQEPKAGAAEGGEATTPSGGAWTQSILVTIGRFGLDADA